ncbi:MAG: hypothetical protein V3W44_08650 [Dehalococcoidales bacterium]
MKVVRELLTDTPPESAPILPIGPEGYFEDDDRIATDTPPESPRKKKKTAPPDKMEITDEMRNWFREKFGEVGSSEVLAETEKFLDFHRAKGNLMKDWPAAWRTWMRNWMSDFGRKTGKGGSPTKADTRRTRLDGMLNTPPAEDDVPY